MRNQSMRKPFVTLSTVVALGLGLQGCDSDRPVAGITNPNPGSMTDADKAAIRTDTPVPHETPSPEAQAAASSVINPPSSNSIPATSEPVTSATKEPSATPPIKENSGDASGATKPSGPIKDGTPKSPQ